MEKLSSCCGEPRSSHPPCNTAQDHEPAWVCSVCRIQTQLTSHTSMSVDMGVCGSARPSTFPLRQARRRAAGCWRLGAEPLPHAAPQCCRSSRRSEHTYAIHFRRGVQSAFPVVQSLNVAIVQFSDRVGLEAERLCGLHICNPAQHAGLSPGAAVCSGALPGNCCNKGAGAPFWTSL